MRCRATAERLCRIAGFEPRTRHVTDNPGAIQALVSNGQGVALLPRSARQYMPIAGIDAIELEGTGARRIIAMMPASIDDAEELTDLLDAISAQTAVNLE